MRPPVHKVVVVGLRAIELPSVDAVRLLTNNPAKCEALEALGVRVQERVPVLTAPTPENYKYLRTKQDRMGARLELE